MRRLEVNGPSPNQQRKTPLRMPLEGCLAMRLVRPDNNFEIPTIGEFPLKKPVDLPPAAPIL